MTAHRRALEIEPGDAETMTNLGIALKESGDAAAAVAAHRRALEIKPGMAGTYHNLGNALVVQGDLEGAVAAFRRALEIRPGFAETYRQLADLVTFTAESRDLAAMRNLLAGGSLGELQEMHLRFALAKAHEDVGDYDQAFVHLDRGNRLKRAAIDFDVADDEALVDRIIATFADTGPAAPAPAGMPVFVLGMPRSGTTLIEGILASHSRVHGAGELETLGRLARGLERGYPEGAAALEGPPLEDFREAYITAVKGLAPQAPRITDKMPGNFLHIGLIHKAFPDARVVHCVRDPVDVCLSCYRRLFAATQNFAYDLAELGRYYRAYERLMRHWHARLPGFIHDVRYEDVVADQKGETARLLEFCGLEWEDACLAFHKSDRPVGTASAVQVRRPIYGTAVKRWKHYEPHIGALLDALGPLVAA